jgi:hypothetical protein
MYWLLGCHATVSTPDWWHAKHQALMVMTALQRMEQDMADSEAVLKRG